jgi:hypothetical protein
MLGFKFLQIWIHVGTKSDQTGFSRELLMYIPSIGKINKKRRVIKIRSVLSETKNKGRWISDYKIPLTFSLCGKTLQSLGAK